ncbi:MAG: hypothetical protein V2B19_09865 [Pseudomonadota bacterium]
MEWKIIPGLKGRVFVPEKQGSTPKKHACRDCFSCQMCSDDRCRLCEGRNCAEKQIREIHDKVSNASGETTSLLTAADPARSALSTLKVNSCRKKQENFNPVPLISENDL